MSVLTLLATVSAISIVGFNRTEHSFDSDSTIAENAVHGAVLDGAVVTLRNLAYAYMGDDKIAAKS